MATKVFCDFDPISEHSATMKITLWKKVGMEVSPIGSWDSCLDHCGALTSSVLKDYWSVISEQVTIRRIDEK